MLNFKNLLTNLVPLALILFFSPFLLLFTFVTTVIWAPFLLLLAINVAIIYFISQQTPTGTRLKEVYLQKIKAKMNKRGPRHFFIESINHVLCLVFPSLQRKVTNYGYAVINQDGKLISDIPVEFEDEVLPIQLYHYLATSFEKKKHLAKMNVLELECQRGGGIDYIARNLKAKRCVGVTSSGSKAKFCQRRYDTPKLEFYNQTMSKVLENKDLTNENFDLIINIEGRSRFGFDTFKEIVEVTAQLLKSGGTFVIADYGTRSEIDSMRQELEASGLKIIKEEDLSLNIQHGFKLEQKKKQNILNTTLLDLIRALLWKLRIRERNKLETSLQNGGSYLAFMLKKE